MNKLIYGIITILMAISFSGCGGKSIQFHPRITNKIVKNQSYKLQKIQVASPGDFLIQKSYENQKVLEPTSFIALKDFNFGNHSMFNKNTVYNVNRKDEKDNKMLVQSNMELYFAKINSDGTLADNNMYINVPGGFSGNILTRGSSNNFNIGNIDEKFFEPHNIKITLSKDSYKYELLYSGLDGNNIKIDYREYSNNFARPAFYQSLTYNLNESKVIQFRKFTIQILEATNSKIKYKILND